NVAESLPWCQSGLCLGMTSALEHVVPHRNVPVSRQRAGEFETLVVATLAKTLGRQRHRHERATLLGYIDRPAHPRHASGDIVRRAIPTAVLQSVDDAQPRETRGPGRAARRANVGRQQRTPAAAFAVRGMTAALTAGLRQERDSSPARSTDEPFVAFVEKPLADRAGARENEIYQSGCTGVQPRRQPESPRAACHIAERSGVTPNHRSNANAACSTSIVRPSIARRPRDRSSRMNAVPPRRYTRSSTAAPGARSAMSIGNSSLAKPTDVALTTRSAPATTPTSSTDCTVGPNRSPRKRARSAVRC